MTLLTIAVITFFLLTAIMFAVETYESMRRNARRQLRAHRRRKPAPHSRHRRKHHA